MSEAIEYKGYTIKIETEDQPMNPREDFDCNLGTMVCFHNRYSLGDKNPGLRSEDYKGWKEMIAAVEKEKGPIVWLPLYLYDHSGITINTTGFNHVDSGHWDWGQLGFIYITYEKARKEYGWKVINKARVEKLKEYLLGEVETYDDYLTGNVYYYTIELPDGTEDDTCGGYYGSDHEKSGLMEQAKNAIDCDITHRLKTEGVQTELALAIA